MSILSSTNTGMKYFHIPLFEFHNRGFIVNAFYDRLHYIKREQSVHRPPIVVNVTNKTVKGKGFIVTKAYVTIHYGVNNFNFEIKNTKDIDLLAEFYQTTPWSDEYKHLFFKIINEHS